jgi:hypothetical protein
MKECGLGYFLLSHPRRAGTVQTYQGMTAAKLHALHDLYNYRERRFGWAGSEHGKDIYHLCHVQPLVGRDGSVGLTTPENLFTGIGRLNQKQGNKPVNAWAGASIPLSERKRKWDVTKRMTQDQVLQKICDFLGPELDIFLDELDKIPPRTKRLRLANSIFRRQEQLLSDDNGYNPLGQLYTLADLKLLTFEELHILDATQQGRTSVRAPDYSKCPIDSELGVLADELARFVEVLSDGQHRENCRFMLTLVHVLGIYLVQINDKQGTARPRFLKIGSAVWSPLSYLYQGQPWRTPAHLLSEDLDGLLNGVYDVKGRELKPGIVPMAQAVLQGLDIDRDHIRNRVLKRLILRTLNPVVAAPDQWSWEDNGSDWLTYIDNLYASLEPTWQALLDVGLCTEEQVLDAHNAVLDSLTDAVEHARQAYLEQPCYTTWHVPFKRFPAWLEFPPIAAERFSHAA